MKSFHPSTAILSLAAALLAGEANDPGGVARAGEPQAPSTPTPAAALPRLDPKPGFIRGRVVDEAGNALNPARITVRVNFVGEVGAPTKANVAVKPDDRGAFEVAATDGYYQSSGAVELVLAGEDRRFDLEPVQDNLDYQDSRKGVVQDYVWKMTGRVSGRDGKPANSTDWYGGSIHMTVDPKATRQPAAGARWVFTLQPVGRRIDGGEARELTLELPCRHPDGMLNGFPVLHDLPPANYQITGREVLIDGTSFPLTLSPGASDPDVTSLEVVFPSGSHGHGLLPYKMCIHRPGK